MPIRPSLILVAVVLSTFSAAATATAGPVKSGSYEFSPKRYADHGNVNLVVTADGKRVKYVYFTLGTRCRIRGQRPSYPTTLSRRKAPIRNGRFSYSRTIRYPQTGAVLKEWFKGRFAPGGQTVTLTGRFTLKRRDGRCDTGTVRSTAQLTDLDHSGPFPGPWSGKTAKGESITFTADRTGITDVRSRATLDCGDGTTVTRDISVADIRFEDGEIRHDNLDARVEPFEIEGTVLAREFKPDPESPGDNIVCSAAEKFTATPARPLDS
jgi:hypothetical protein